MEHFVLVLAALMKIAPLYHLLNDISICSDGTIQMRKKLKYVSYNQIPSVCGTRSSIDLFMDSWTACSRDRFDMSVKNVACFKYMQNNFM